jgi:hypothetical protein
MVQAGFLVPDAFEAAALTPCRAMRDMWLTGIVSRCPLRERARPHVLIRTTVSCPATHSLLAG